MTTFGGNKLICPKNTKDEDNNPITDRIDVAACLASNENLCWWTTVQGIDYTITGIPSGEFVINAYDWPGGIWFGKTYPDRVTLDVGQNISDILFKLSRIVE